MVVVAPLTLMALVAQKLWYFTPAASSSARTLAWLSFAVFCRAVATAVPRSFQSLMALALARSAFGAKRIQKSDWPLAWSVLLSSGRILSDAAEPGAACAAEPVAATLV